MSKEGFPGGCNPADVLYKLAHNKGIKPPIFEMISEQGPPHARTFTWSCSFYEGKYHTMAAGRSKKEAKNAVAKALIDQIDLNELPTKQKAFGRYDRSRGGKRKMNELEGEDNEGENGAAENGEDTPNRSNKPKNKKKKRSAGGNRQIMGNINFNTDPNPGFMMGFGNPIFNPAMGLGMPPMGMAMGPGMGMGMGMPGMGMGNRMMSRGPPMRLNRDDHMVINKHKSIYPTKDELQLLLKLTETTERSLKRVSDKFCIKEEKVEVGGEEKTTTKKVEGDREIMGVARVGDIAKGLLLTGDKSASLVVMCRNKPTEELLDKISSSVAADLKERPESEKKGHIVIEDSELEVHTFVEEAGFCVVLNRENVSAPYAINVQLTCTKMRAKEPVAKEESEEKKEGEEEDETKVKEEKMKEDDDEEEDVSEDPVGVLNKDKCLEFLAQLRRAKWFTSMAASLENCVESIRIFKELARREEAWKPVGDWGLELLVERALASVAVTQVLSPSKAIMRVLEVVASGIALPDGAGIKDPCERSNENVLKHLTGQQLEDLTFSAQDMLRKAHYRKFYQILDVEKPEPKVFKKEEKKNEETEEKTEEATEATA